MKNLFICMQDAIQSVNFYLQGHYLKTPICNTLIVASYENLNFYLKGHIYFRDCSLLIKLIPKYIYYFRQPESLTTGRKESNIMVM